MYQPHSLSIFYLQDILREAFNWMADDPGKQEQTKYVLFEPAFSWFPGLIRVADP